MDKKEAFLLLSRDTSILPAIEHFSVLVNPDSLQDNRDLPVIIHALVSNGNGLRYCILSATRLNEQYKGAFTDGSTEKSFYVSDIVTVIANKQSAEQQFAYWERDGKIVSMVLF